MNFLESILFLVFYVGIIAGVPLIWYARKVSGTNDKDFTE